MTRFHNNQNQSLKRRHFVFTTMLGLLRIPSQNASSPYRFDSVRPIPYHVILILLTLTRGAFMLFSDTIVLGIEGDLPSQSARLTSWVCKMWGILSSWTCRSLHVCWMLHIHGMSSSWPCHSLRWYLSLECASLRYCASLPCKCNIDINHVGIIL